MTHRTKSNPGPEMSQTEQQLRFLVAARNQAVYAPADKLAKLDAEIAALTEKMNRPRAPRKPKEGPDERDILKDILKMLRKHPKVGIVWRQNSVVAKFSDRHGEVRRVKANTARGMSDIMGTLIDGRALAIEVKVPGKQAEPHQAQFLFSIAKSGGVAFVAHSEQEAKYLLEKS